MNRLIAIGAVCLVVGALIAGLFVVGSPNQARNEKYDQTRLEDLRGIIRALDCKNPTGMPAELTRDAISSVCSKGYPLKSLTDPKTDELYEFRIVTDVKFEVCATFYNVDSLKESKALKNFPQLLKFKGNVGCLTQTTVKLEPT